MVELKVFAPGEDAREIYKFRYEIYEQEMHRNDAYADHDLRQIRDPQDNHSYNVVALKKDEIVGVARYTVCSDGDAGFYGDFYEMDTVGDDYPSRTSYATRLMVVPGQRGRLLPLLLTAECFKAAFSRGMKWCYVDCNAHRVPYFQKLFFETVIAQKEHPRFGLVSIMRVDLSNPDIRDPHKSVIAKYL